MAVDKPVLNKKTRIWIVAAVIVLAVVSAFFWLGRSAVGNHEAYVGVTARNMLESGDWVRPVFNGEPRLQKTPLCYWLVGVGGKVFGEVNDFILRLPSASLAVLTAMAILYFVNQWLGIRAAAISAILWASCLGYIQFSHTGRPEMALSCFVTIGMLSFYSALQSQSRRKQVRYMLIFWVSFSLAMLAKGPAPLPLMMGPLFFYFAVFRKWKAIPKLLPVVGVIIFLVIFLPWPLLILSELPEAGQVWKDEYLGRAAGEYASGGKPFYYYFKVIFRLFAPWVAFVPMALASPFYRVWERKQKPMMYLWFWLVISILLMTVSGGKRQHYILPSIPALAIISGIILDDMLFIRKAYSKRFARNFVLIHLSAAAVLVGGISYWYASNPKSIDHNYVIKDFAIRTSQLVGDEEGLTAYCKVNPSFVYYCKRDVAVETDLGKITELYDGGNCILAVGDKAEELGSREGFEALLAGIDDGRVVFKKR